MAKEHINNKQQQKQQQRLKKFNKVHSGSLNDVFWMFNNYMTIYNITNKTSIQRPEKT